MAIVDDTTTAFLDLRGVLDPAKEVEKLTKKRADVRPKPYILCVLPLALQLNVPSTLRTETQASGRKRPSSHESPRIETVKYWIIVV